MTTSTILTAVIAAAIVTWLLRIALITLLPADRLPEGIRGALPLVGPAAMAALVVTTSTAQASAGISWPRQMAALVAAAVVARLGANLGVVVVVAITVGGLFSLFGG
jgi:branched-subunit amino acid transport protein